MTILASYNEDEWEEPQFYWVRPIPAGYDLSAEVEFESVDLREIGFRGDFRDEPERLDFIQKAVADGKNIPGAGVSPATAWRNDMKKNLSSQTNASSDGFGVEKIPRYGQTGVVHMVQAPGSNAGSRAKRHDGNGHNGCLACRCGIAQRCDPAAQGLHRND